MSLDLIDACKLLTSDMALSLDDAVMLAFIQSQCIDETLTKFTCDLIGSHWEYIWKELLSKMIDGTLCKNLLSRTLLYQYN